MSAMHEHRLPNGMTLLCCRQAHLHAIEFGLYFKDICPLPEGSAPCIQGAFPI